jgi:tight adherence protein C
MIFIAMAAGALFLAVILVGELASGPSPLKRRAKFIQAQAKQKKKKGGQINSGRPTGASLHISQLLRRLNLGSREVQEPIRLKLLAAGLRGSRIVETYLFAKLVCPFGLGILCYMILLSGIYGDVQTGQMMIISGGAVLLGYVAPEIYVSNRRAKRAKSIQRSLPDGLDLLVICAEAGLSLDMALNRVAEELGPSGPELADELELTSVELNFMPDRRTALINLSERVNSKAMRSVVNTLLQTEKYGTPLTQSLRVLSEEFREERMLKAEEKAARLPAILTVPMIVFILPTLFVVLIGPAALDVYDQFITAN